MALLDRIAAAARAALMTLRREAPDWDPVLALRHGYGWMSTAGQAVNDRGALSVPSFASCIGVVSGALASEEWQLVRFLEDGGTMPLRGPVADLIRNISFATKERWLSDALIAGTSYLAYDAGELICLPRQHVTLWWSEEGVRSYQYLRPNRPQQSRTYAESDVALLKYREWSSVQWFGLPPMLCNSDVLGLGIAARLFQAAEMRNGSKPRGFLQTAGKIDRVKAAEIAERWSANYGGPEQAGKTAVLEQGLTYQQLQVADFEAVQMIELTRATDVDVARAFNVPPMIIGELGGSNRSNAAEESRSFVAHCLRPFARRVGNAIEIYLRGKGMITAADRVDISLNDLVQGYGVELHDSLSKATLGGYQTPNESRTALGLPAIAGGDQLLRPVNVEALSDVARRMDRLDALAQVKAGELPPGSPEPEPRLEGVDPATLRAEIAGDILSTLSAELMHGPQAARQRADMERWSRNLIDALKRELAAEREARQAESRAAEMAAEIDEVAEIEAFRAQLASRRMEG
jgi:HK97 family phage portal protein